MEQKKEKKKISSHDITRRLAGITVTALILLAIAIMWVHVFFDKATVFPD